jgi:hypothetical protein
VENPSQTQEQRDWLTGWQTPVFLHNSSQEPAYEVVVGVVAIQGTAPRTLETMVDFRRRRSKEPRNAADYVMPATTLAILPPGTWRAWVRGRGWQGGMGGRPSADVAFVDCIGNSWIRRATGEMQEFSKKPLEYFEQFGLYGPHDLVSPEPVLLFGALGSTPDV